MVTVENAVLETIQTKNGKSMTRYRGVCPNDGSKLFMIAKASAKQQEQEVVGSGLPEVQSVPLAVSPIQMMDDEMSNKMFKVIVDGLGKQEQVGSGVASFLSVLAPSLIPLIPDIVRGIGSLFGNGFTFPDNQWGSGVATIPIPVPLLQPITTYSKRKYKQPGTLLSASAPGTFGPVLTNQTMIGSLGRAASGGGLKFNKDPMKELEMIAKKALGKKTTQ